MTFVIDASVTLTWFFADERTTVSDAVLDRVAEFGATVPALWRLEVANALLVAFRRKRVSAAFRDQAIQRLAKLPIAVDSDTDSRAWTNTLPLAEQTGLSVYDSCYLELAIRLGVALASTDRALCDAAKRAGVEVVAT